MSAIGDWGEDAKKGRKWTVEDGRCRVWVPWSNEIKDSVKRSTSLRSAAGHTGLYGEFCRSRGVLKPCACRYRPLSPFSPAPDPLHKRAVRSNCTSPSPFRRRIAFCISQPLVPTFFFFSHPPVPPPAPTFVFVRLHIHAALRFLSAKAPDLDPRRSATSRCALNNPHRTETNRNPEPQPPGSEKITLKN